MATLKAANGKLMRNDYEKNLIKSLDLDFLQYLTQLEACINNVGSELEKRLVQVQYY